MRLRRLWNGILWLPVVLIALVVLYEVIGMAVNHAASTKQTKDAIKTLERSLSSVEIVDSYTETGNTSGTGNHVDMLSVVLFRTGAEFAEIESSLRAYDGLDEWSFWVRDMEGVMASREKYPASFLYLEEMDISGDLEQSYLLYINTSAPFPDNIEGH